MAKAELTIEIRDLEEVKNELKAKDQRIAELEEQLKEVEGKYAYECECNKQFVECQNENEKLKAENERLKKYETIYYMNQLQANNEDINKFKQNGFQQCINIFELLKDNTKQVRKEVCEEIRKWCDRTFNWVGDGTGYDGQDYNEMIGSNNTINKLRELLDQIEKGEI